jgi:hypothetical protein
VYEPIHLQSLCCGHRSATALEILKRDSRANHKNHKKHGGTSPLRRCLIVLTGSSHLTQKVSSASITDNRRIIWKTTCLTYICSSSFSALNRLSMLRRPCALVLANFVLVTTSFYLGGLFYGWQDFWPCHRNVLGCLFRPEIVSISIKILLARLQQSFDICITRSHTITVGVN